MSWADASSDDEFEQHVTDKTKERAVSVDEDFRYVPQAPPTKKKKGGHNDNNNNGGGGGFHRNDRNDNNGGGGGFTRNDRDNNNNNNNGGSFQRERHIRVYVRQHDVENTTEQDLVNLFTQAGCEVTAAVMPKNPDGSNKVCVYVYVCVCANMQYTLCDSKYSMLEPNFQLLDFL
jgi:hypothetical protein